MNSLYPHFPCLTPLVRVSELGEEVILSNLANGKWIRISRDTFEQFRSFSLVEIRTRLLQIAPAEDVESLLSVLVGYDFIDSGERKKYPEEFDLCLRTTYLNVTNFCNLTCKHCYFGSHPGLGHGLSNPAMFKILDSFRSARISALVISGGEPLLRPGIEEILDYAHSLGFSEITLLTNGTAVSKDLAFVIARCVTRVHVSIDGPDEETHAVLRGRGHFHQSLQGIRALKRAGVRKIRIITSITSNNLHRMHEMRRLRDDLDVELGTTIFTAIGRGGEYLGLQTQEKEMIEFFLKEIALLSCDTSETDNSILDVQAGVSCGSGTSMISVDCFGNVFPCHLLHRQDFFIGNLVEQPDLSEMMRTSKIAIQFRSRLVEYRKCHGCPVEYFCKGGCLARTIVAHHNKEAPWKERDPLCRVHRAVLRAQIWPS